MAQSVGVDNTPAQHFLHVPACTRSRRTCPLPQQSGGMKGFWGLVQKSHSEPGTSGRITLPFCTAGAVHGTARHSTAQHSTAQHSTAQHSTARHSTARHSTAHTM
jgi:hypothetical protein